jgi:carbon storage regulator
MLVVTRRKGQRIVIGNDIEVVVSGISGSTVRLAVVAPRSVTVLRGEVYETVLEQNRAAAETSIGDEFEKFLDAAPAPSETEIAPGGAAQLPEHPLKAATKRTIVKASAARSVNRPAEEE